MHHSLNKGLKVLGSMGIAAAGAVIGKTGALGPILSPVIYVIGHMFTHFGGEVASHLSEELTERFGKDPKQLNHHLQHLYAHSLCEAITEGLPASYERERSETLTKEHRKHLQKLGKEWEHAFSHKSLSSSELIHLLDEKNHRSATTYRSLFENRVEEQYRPEHFFSTHDFYNGFARYFETNFLLIVRILFIEGLKNKEFEKARVAYDQMMSEEIFKGLTDLKKDIAELKEQGSLASSRYHLLPTTELSASIEKLQSPEQIQSYFTPAMNQYFQQFDEKLEDILLLEKDTNMRVSRIDYKTDRIDKGVKRGLFLSYFLVIVAIGLVAFGYVYFRKKTFNATVELRDGNNQPITSGTLAISYGIKREKVNVNADGLAMFTQIPSHFEHDSVEILLLDELGKKYRVEPVSAKVLLSEEKIIPIYLREKGLGDQPGQTNGGETEPARPIAQLPQPQNLAKQSNGVTTEKEKPVTTVIQKQQTIKEMDKPGVAQELNGASFSQSTSEDNLNFSKISNNVLSFSGKGGRFPVMGKMRCSGNNLTVIEGNVKGTLTFTGNQIRGSLIVVPSQWGWQVALTRN